MKVAWILSGSVLGKYFYRIPNFHLVWQCVVQFQFIGLNKVKFFKRQRYTFSFRAKLT